MRLDNCCCCISIWKGTMIIGCLLFTDLLVELKYPSNIRLIVKLITIACFLTMVWRDLELTRMIFFFVYCFNRAIEIINDIWVIDVMLESFQDYACSSEKVPHNDTMRA